MNKLIILIGAVIVCAGCAPAAHPPAPVPVAPAVVVPPVVVAPPKAEVIDMPAAPKKPLLAVQVYPGSLKENVERIAAHYGWHQVVWDAPQDFAWVGYAQIHGENLNSVLRQLLNDYPLQAVFYQGNHVLYIHPRTLK